MTILRELSSCCVGFWGAYSSFSKHGRATFGFISFTFLSILLDIVFCAVNSHRASVFEFCLTMFILCMLLKVYALYQSSLFFTSIGGAYSLESSKLTTSMYESLSKCTVSSTSDGTDFDVSSCVQSNHYRGLSALFLQSRRDGAGGLLSPRRGWTPQRYIFSKQK